MEYTKVNLENSSKENTALLNVSEVTIHYSSKVKASDRKSITCSRDAAEVFRISWDINTMEHVETMKLILLNRANKVLGISTLSTGGTSGCLVDVKVIFQYALKTNASSIIMCHNHPSGNIKPSHQDLQISKKVKEAGNLLDISLLDHLILTPYDEHYSMADEGDL